MATCLGWGVENYGDEQMDAGDPIDFPKLCNRPWQELFAVDRTLGVGGQGTTRLVRAIECPDKVFALKTLLDNNSHERRLRMYREVAALEALDHPGIAKLITSNVHLHETASELFVAMEYIEGEPLNKIGQNFTDVDAAVKITLAIAQSLQHCHSRQIIHRDIKPANIIYPQKNKRPVLIDFGLSFNQVDDAGDATFTGQHIGNRFIIVPEFRGRHSDKRNSVSDITHLVGVLFWLVTGQAPEMLVDEVGKAPHERPAAKVVLETLPIAQQLNLVRTFTVGFASSMSSRWQSCDELMSHLGRLLEQRGEEPLAFADRLKHLSDAYSSLPSVVLGRRLDGLARHFQKENNRVSQVALRMANEVSGGFGRWSVDTTKGFIRAEGSVHAKLPSERNMKVVVACGRQDDSLHLQLMAENHVVQQGLVRIEDPQALELITAWLETAWLSLLKHVAFPQTT